MYRRKGVVVRCAMSVALLLALGVPGGAVAKGEGGPVAGPPQVDTASGLSTTRPSYLNGHTVGEMSTLGITPAGGIETAATGSIEILDLTFTEGSGSITIEGLLWNCGTTPLEDISVRVSMYGMYDNLLHDYRREDPPNVGDLVLYPGDVSTFDVTLPIHGDEYYFLVSGSGVTCSKMPVYLGLEVYTAPTYYAVTVHNDTDYTMNWVIINHVDIDGDTGEIIRVEQFWVAGAPAWGDAWETIPCDCTGPDDISYIWAEGQKDPTGPTAGQRVSGFDRYETAIAASQASFSASTSSTAVLVSGKGFADALSASLLAGVCGGPILLVRDDDVSGFVQDELTRLDVRTAYIVGGTGAVSGTFESNLRDYLPEGSRVERIAGADRYSTCAEVARVARELHGAPFEDAFVARGDSYPDALAASPFAFSQHMPILLVRPTAAPDVILDVADEVGVGDLWVLGGTGAVSESCVGQFGLPSTRLAGATRYETAAIVAVTGFDEGWTDFGTLGIATGKNFPDALSGGAALGNQGGALLLSSPTILSREAGWAITVCAQSIDELWFFGGTGAISDMTVDTASYLCE